MRWSVTWANIGVPSSDVPAEDEWLHMWIEHHGIGSNDITSTKCTLENNDIMNICGATINTVIKIYYVNKGVKF